MNYIDYALQWMPQVEKKYSTQPERKKKSNDNLVVNFKLIPALNSKFAPNLYLNQHGSDSMAPKRIKVNQI